MWNLTLKMLGTLSKPALNAKAKETQGLLHFAVELLEANRAAVRLAKPDETDRIEMLIVAGRHAMHFEQMLADLPRAITDEQRARLFAAYSSHVRCFKLAGAELKPKAHAMLHCIQRSKVLGSPRFYHTYRDESMNRIIANIAVASHRALFAVSVFMKFAVMQQLGLGRALG